MSFWTAVIIIVAIWAVLQAYKAKHGILPDEHGSETQKPRSDPETVRELEELRERVKVLERITVDGREARQIADEIERLKDK